ncbi:hypothetical protein [Prevotella sp. E2-28]|uniref:hypothetical protein n=1 Tax=Prevotella sp. E2-28 TaxID=2913620 RepID=UPI001EDA776A|nr:hypothetical protein [Prevotella sp. E2-28]UKK53555.1 hypothetical protein L6465_13410 [Prevotella sp. E2-28]
MTKSFIYRFIALAAFIFVGVNMAIAQNEYEYEVVFKDSEVSDSVKEIHKRITYGHWSNVQKAVELARKMKKARDVDYASDAELRDILKKEAGKTSTKGTFTFEGLATTGVIILDEDNHIFLVKHRDGNGRWEGTTISDSPDQEFRVECKSLGSNKFKYKVTVDILSKKGTTKFGEAQGGGDSGYNFDFEDGFEHFQISLNQLPAEIRESKSRIILLPYAIDCQTDDTIAYLRPAVYEGAEYHELQDKRKDFDYSNKDTLGQARVMSTKIFIRSDTTWRDTTYTMALKDSRGRLIEDGVDANGNPKFKQEVKHERIITNISQVEKDTVMAVLGYIKPIDKLKHDRGHILVDTTISFRKPDKKKTYRGMVRYTMEDYHHAYYDAIFPGTCLHVRPFKFLEANNTVAEFELDRDLFYQKPEEGRVSIPPKDLGMFFEHGSTKLIEDSAYLATINQIHADMHDIVSSGGQLTKGSLTAYASPDGSEATNRRLAQGRAEVAKTKINSPTLRNVSISAVIDTWDHTAELLEKAGLMEEAAFVRECIASSNGQREVAWRKIAAYPNYKETIKPIVESQCRITFTYEYFAQKVLTAKEAAEIYKKSPNRMFSNGDYFNIFTEIKDSLELDRLTEIAYDRVITKNGDIESQFAPYIINRMALLKLRQGTPDTMMLKPLIDESKRFFTFNDHNQGSDITFNRPEIILNQAVMFYMLNEPARAKGLVNKLKRDYPDLKGVQELVNFINFKDLVKIPADRRSNQQKREFRDALTMLENAAADNRAVLYTEFPTLNKRNTEAWDYVTLMDDNNPKKWYLMGLLWATRDGQEKFVYPLQEDDDSISYGDETIPTDDFPYYIAYFWKSFDLDKSPDKAMMKYYFNEGYINEELRKKKNHAYKVSRIPTYKKIFRLRKKEDDKRKAELLKMVKDGVINYDEQNGSTEETESRETAE